VYVCHCRKVLAADLKRDAAVETKRIIDSEGGICMAVAGDVSRADDVAAIVDACIRSFGCLESTAAGAGCLADRQPRVASGYSREPRGRCSYGDSGTDGSQTLPWREVDSNHRSPSRDCRRSERFAQRS
jgi:NAD(P)-dependent dehydrogenase (short-subunit alcohol dehydrogenase family)